MKATLDSLDGVPDSLHEHYSQQSDGSFRLAIEGPVHGHVPAAEAATQKATLAEFRQKNTEMLLGIADVLGVEKVENPVTQLKEHLAKYDGIDPEEFQKLQAQAKALKAKGVTQPADVAELVASQVKDAVSTAIKPMRAELKTERQARAIAEAAKDDADFRDIVWGKVQKLGAKTSHKKFLLFEARDVFEMKNEKVVAKDGEYNKDGDPLTLDDWATAAIVEHDSSFGESSGGDRKQRAGGHVPGLRELVNPTSKQLGDPRTAKAIKDKKLKIVHR